jgi:hypothetical protein
MKKATLVLLIFALYSSCSDVDEFKGVKIRQYADEVIEYSSQYSSGNWSANRILGKENVYPNYGDNVNAWASSTRNGQREYIIVAFDTVQTVHTIEIFETYYPGAIDTVYLRNESTQKWQRIYSKPALTDLPAESRIFTIYMTETSYLVDALRIAINSPEVDGWNEIDAIAISGQRRN